MLFAYVVTLDIDFAVFIQRLYLFCLFALFINLMGLFVRLYLLRAEDG